MYSGMNRVARDFCVVVLDFKTAKIIANLEI